MQVINLLIVIGALLGVFALGARWIDTQDKPSKAEADREIIVTDAVEVEAYAEKPLREMSDFDRTYHQIIKTQGESSLINYFRTVGQIGRPEGCSNVQK